MMMGTARTSEMLRAPGATPAGVTVTTCGLDDDRDVALAEARSWLSQDELRRADRFHFPHHRDRYVRGRGYLRREMARLTCQAPEDLVLAVGANGKPLIPGGPEFNLSNSRDLAVLAISDDGPLGIDIEFQDRGVQAMELAHSCFVEAEIAVLADLASDARQQRFFAFWTAKEALMKLTGLGMSLPPRSIALELDQGWPVGFSQPQTPRAGLSFFDTGIADVICCIAYAEGS